MAAEGSTGDLLKVVALLGAAVVAVPLFRRFGLGSVLGYLAGGLAIGPFGLGLFTHPGAILHVAELGVVMFLFVIGLEMQPSRLWAMKGDIFGLGLAQVGVCIDAFAEAKRSGAMERSRSYMVSESSMTQVGYRTRARASIPAAR